MLKREYESLADFIQATEQSLGYERFTETPDDIPVDVGRRFESWEEVIHAASQAWPEGIAILQGMLADLGQVAMPRPQSRRRVRRFSDQGDDLNYDRFRSGQEDCWETRARESRDGRQFVRILCQMGAPCGESPENLFWRGAAAIILADQLEKAGYSVEVVAFSHCRQPYRDNTDDYRAAVIKPAGQPVDQATLVNVFSGWFYRTIGFQEHLVARKPVSENLGITSSYPFPIGNDEIVIQQIWSRYEALEFVRAKLQEYGRE